MLGALNPRASKPWPRVEIKHTVRISRRNETSTVFERDFMFYFPKPFWAAFDSWQEELIRRLFVDVLVSLEAFHQAFDDWA
jgi:hypothetical protein